MDFKISHSLPGRVRLRYERHILSLRQAMLVQMLVGLQEGIVSISVNTVSGSILIEYKDTSLETVLSYVKALDGKYLNDENLLSSVSVPSVQESLLESLLSLTVEHFLKKLLPLPLRKIISLVSIVPRVQKGIASVVRGKPFCAETLDAAAISLSYLTGDIDTAGTINFLLNIGDTLEDYTKRKSHDNLTQSLLITDETVTIVQDGEEKEISTQLLKAGDIVIVRAGSVIPVDGTVVDGVGMVNQASMTGEALPVQREKGSSVFASTIIEEGEIKIKVKACGGETKVSKIANMIDRSNSLKAASQEKAERVADNLVKYNFLIAGLAYFFTRNFTKAASTLLVDYSCAMKLSAPISVLSAMRDCARNGILAKGGKFLEEFAESDTIVFDKTGTLTESNPVVKKIVVFGSRKENEVLKLAACLEEHFPHSLARAVVNEAASRGLNHKEEHTKVEYILAHGIASSLDGKKLRIGSAHFIFDDEKIPLTKEADDCINTITGCSQLYFAIDGELAAIIVIEDPIRKESCAVIKKLKDSGFKNVIMITGDNKHTAKEVAEKTGVTDFVAEALPDTKVSWIEKLKKEGHKVVMVGDGINDSPALSAANVGIAMGKASSIASETADILLPDDGLDSLPVLRKISRNLISRIHGNNRAIIGINSALIAGGLAGSITPQMAALLHNSSTVAISVNAMSSLD